MTREQIEKAAKGYVMPNARISPLMESIAAKEGFIAGAQWRINSAWQKPSAYGKELKRGIEIIAKTKKGYRFGKFDVVGYSHEYVAFVSTSSLEYALSDVLEYAYLDDLLSDRKEDER